MACIPPPSGAVLLGGATDGALALVREIRRDKPLSSPAIIVGGADLTVAFIEDAGTAAARFVQLSVKL